jgi:hypothetical protein
MWSSCDIFDGVNDIIEASVAYTPHMRSFKVAENLDRTVLFKIGGYSNAVRGE